MKVLLEDGNYQLFAELRPIAALNNEQHELVFTSKWSDSKNPDDEQVRAKFIINNNAIEKFRSILS